MWHFNVTLGFNLIRNSGWYCISQQQMMPRKLCNLLKSNSNQIWSPTAKIKLKTWASGNKINRFFLETSKGFAKILTLSYPMFSVNIFVSIPLSGQKWMLFADDFPVEKRRQSGIFVRQAFDFEISAQVRAFQVDMLKKKTIWVKSKAGLSVAIVKLFLKKKQSLNKA